MVSLLKISNSSIISSQEDKEITFKESTINCAEIVKKSFSKLYSRNYIHSKSINLRQHRLLDRNETELKKILQQISILGDGKLSKKNKNVLIESSPTKKSQIAAIHHIFDACQFALKQSRTEADDHNIRKEILIKLKHTKWFRHISKSDKTIKSRMNELTKDFKVIEKQNRELQNLSMLTTKTYGKENSEFSKVQREMTEIRNEMKNFASSEEMNKLNDVLTIHDEEIKNLDSQTPALRQSIRDANETEKKSKKQILEAHLSEIQNKRTSFQKARRLKDFLNQTAMQEFCKFDFNDPKIKETLSPETITNLQNLQDRAKECYTRFDKLRNNQESLLYQQLLLKLDGHMDDKIMEENSMISSDALLYSYLWVMKSEDLFENLSLVLTKLENYILDPQNKDQKSLLVSARRQQLRLLDFCEQWLKSGMYTYEVNKVTDKLNQIIKSAKQTRSKRLHQKVKTLKSLLAKHATTMSKSKTSNLNESMKKLKSAVTNYIQNGRTENPNDIDNLSKELGAIYTQIFGKIELLDLFKSNKKEVAVNFSEFGNVEETITNTISNQLKEIRNNSNNGCDVRLNNALCFYDSLIEHCILTHNYALAETIFNVINSFVVNHNNITLKPSMKQKINEYSQFFLNRDKKEDNVSTRINNCIRKEKTFIPHPRHIAHNFEQFGNTLPILDDPTSKNKQKVNVAQMMTIKPQIIQWFKTKNLIQKFDLNV